MWDNILSNTFGTKGNAFSSININKIPWDLVECFVSCTKLQYFIGAFMWDFSYNSNHTNSKLPITDINGPLKPFPRTYNEFTTWCYGNIQWTGIYKNYYFPCLLLLELLSNRRRGIIVINDIKDPPLNFNW